jgi:hypothetical protein
LTYAPEAMPKRDFLATTDFTRDEIVKLFDLARRMKAGQYRETPLSGKTLAMIFAKSSTRTRVSFEVGTYQLGGYTTPSVSSSLLPDPAPTPPAPWRGAESRRPRRANRARASASRAILRRPLLEVAAVELELTAAPRRLQRHLQLVQVQGVPSIFRPLLEERH